MADEERAAAEAAAKEEAETASELKSLELELESLRGQNTLQKHAFERTLGQKQQEVLMARDSLHAAQAREQEVIGSITAAQQNLSTLREEFEANPVSEEEIQELHSRSQEIRQRHQEMLLQIRSVEEQIQAISNGSAVEEYSPAPEEIAEVMAQNDRIEAQAQVVASVQSKQESDLQALKEQIAFLSQSIEGEEANVRGLQTRKAGAQERRAELEAQLRDLSKRKEGLVAERLSLQNLLAKADDLSQSAVQSLVAKETPPSPPTAPLPNTLAFSELVRMVFEQVESRLHLVEEGAQPAISEEEATLLSQLLLVLEDKTEQLHSIHQRRQSLSRPASYVNLKAAAGQDQPSDDNVDFGAAAVQKENDERLQGLKEAAALLEQQQAGGPAEASKDTSESAAEAASGASPEPPVAGLETSPASQPALSEEPSQQDAPAEASGQSEELPKPDAEQPASESSASAAEDADVVVFSPGGTLDTSAEEAARWKAAKLAAEKEEQEELRRALAAHEMRAQDEEQRRLAEWEETRREIDFLQDLEKFARDEESRRREIVDECTEQMDDIHQESQWKLNLILALEEERVERRAAFLAKRSPDPSFATDDADFEGLGLLLAASLPSANVDAPLLLWAANH
eukprot:NODE_308_length_2265_cov_11.137635_g240_i0.p1 GENE.NODE_308_length_2265_cov_11.137635_g240_i0~~NODE_308_length_2265_cov_11.137635_g240_i0.p1  ORF type:complete len:740 (+),score=235.78 NODE_308_length_2265_cov_11.137635_g240_i0:334-2220(+)